MARCESYIGLSIDQWAKLMGFDLYEINQCTMGLPMGATNSQLAACNHAFFQYSWQQDFLSREEIGLAIQKAEDMLAEYLGYYTYPRYIMNEELQYPRPAERYLFGGGTTKRWQNKALQTRWQKIQAAGTLVATDLGAQNVVYSSANSQNAANSILDTFTVTFTVPVGVTSPSQLALYFTPSDRDNAPFDQTWRIRPVNVTISGTTATITGHRALCVKPELTTMYAATMLDVTVAGNFVTQLEAYSLILDQSTTTSDPAQGQAEWEGIMVNGIFTNCDIPPCQVEVWPVCLGVRDWEQGLASVDYLLAGQNAPTQAREPDRVVVNYVAGVPLDPYGKVDPEYAKIVAHLATGLLPVDSCACERSRRIVHWWRSYPTDGLGMQRQITPKEVDENPFGQNMGCLYAWNRVKHLVNLEAVVI